MGKEEKKSYEELQEELERATVNCDFWRERYKQTDEQYRLFREAVGNLLKLTDY